MSHTIQHIQHLHESSSSDGCMAAGLVSAAAATLSPDDTTAAETSPGNDVSCFINDSSCFNLCLVIMKL